jgi:hypothetical protein
MSLEFVALVAVGSLASAVGGRMICGALWGFSSRTANDVFPFLLKMDLEALYGTFHPEAEDQLKKTLPEKEFRTVQLKRIHLAIHYSDQISHNARVFLGWTRHERQESWQGMTHGVRKTVQELRIACIQCRLSAFLIRTRLRWWLVRTTLMPFAPLPSFSTLSRLGSADMIAFYEMVRAQAEVFSLAYGDEYHQKLMQAL